MAALEASERPDQKGVALESGTAKHYPGCLRLVCQQEGSWVGSPTHNYTMEASMPTGLKVEGFGPVYRYKIQSVAGVTKTGIFSHAMVSLT